MVLLGMSEASRRLRIHPITLRRWAESGKIVPIRDSAGRRLYTEEQIDECISQREMERQQKAGGKI